STVVPERKVGSIPTSRLEEARHSLQAASAAWYASATHPRLPACSTPGFFYTHTRSPSHGRSVSRCQTKRFGIFLITSSPSTLLNSVPEPGSVAGARGRREVAVAQRGIAQRDREGLGQRLDRRHGQAIADVGRQVLEVGLVVARDHDVRDAGAHGAQHL